MPLTQEKKDPKLDKWRGQQSRDVDVPPMVFMFEWYIYETVVFLHHFWILEGIGDVRILECRNVRDLSSHGGLIFPFEPKWNAYTG